MERVLGDEDQRMDKRLFERAQRASWIAKASWGAQRERAYAIKARCLRQMVQYGSAVIDVDSRVCPGLLLVGYEGGPRLHTHESWLFPHEPWQRAAS